MDADDLQQEAFVAMLEAVKRWDEGRGAFLTIYGLSLKGGLTIAAGCRTKRERLDPIQNCLSLDAPIPGGVEDDAVFLSDVVPDHAAEESMEDVEERDSLEKLRDAFQMAFISLTDREVTVIRARYWHGLTQEQAAKQIGVSAMAVHNAEKSAIRHLRHPAIRKIFEPWEGA